MMTAVMAIAGIGGSAANMAGASEAKRANVSVPVKEIIIEAGIRKTTKKNWNMFLLEIWQYIVTTKII